MRARHHACQYGSGRGGTVLERAASGSQTGGFRLGGRDGRQAFGAELRVRRRPSAALMPWRKARVVHDLGKILLDIALAVVSGGDCLADVGMLRAEPAVFGPVACDPISRLIDALAASGEKALRAIRAARAQVRERIWRLAGRAAPGADGTVTADLDGVLVIAHSGRGTGSRPGSGSTAITRSWRSSTTGRAAPEGPVATLLRPGNAGSNTAADHITAAQLALAHLLKKFRRGRRTLVRTASAGGTHDFVAWLTQRGRWLSYSVAWRSPM